MTRADDGLVAMGAVYPCAGRRVDGSSCRVLIIVCQNCVAGLVPARDWVMRIKRVKSIWWMPWHQEAMKDVARCDKPRGAASRL
jgi:hypothetical protein